MKPTTILLLTAGTAFVLGLVGISPAWADGGGDHHNLRHMIEDGDRATERKAKRTAKSLANRARNQAVKRVFSQINVLRNAACPDGQFVRATDAFEIWCAEPQLPKKPKPFVVWAEGVIAPKSLGKVVAWCPEGYVAIGGNINLGPQAQKAELERSLFRRPTPISFGGQFPEGDLVEVGRGGEDNRPYYHPFIGWGVEAINVSREPLPVEVWAQCKYLPYYEHD